MAELRDNRGDSASRPGSSYERSENQNIKNYRAKGAEEPYAGGREKAGASYHHAAKPKGAAEGGYAYSGDEGYQDGARRYEGKRYDEEHFAQMGPMEGRFQRYGEGEEDGRFAAYERPGEAPAEAPRRAAAKGAGKEDGAQAQVQVQPAGGAECPGDGAGSAMAAGKGAAKEGGVYGRALNPLVGRQFRSNSATGLSLSAAMPQAVRTPFVRAERAASPRGSSSEGSTIFSESAHIFRKGERESSESDDGSVSTRLSRGRKKIKMEFIRDKGRRGVTFSKRKKGIMKKAYELNMLTKCELLLVVASETGHVYTFATPKLQPMVKQHENLIQHHLNSPDPAEMCQKVYDSDRFQDPPGSGSPGYYKGDGYGGYDSAVSRSSRTYQQGYYHGGYDGSQR